MCTPRDRLAAREWSMQPEVHVVLWCCVTVSAGRVTHRTASPCTGEASTASMATCLGAEMNDVGGF
eukprot:scaffold68682_cov45-Phaeocystis_antarctica.AAC.1